MPDTINSVQDDYVAVGLSKTTAYHIYKEFSLLMLCYETARENKTLVTIKKTS